MCANYMNFVEVVSLTSDIFAVSIKEKAVTDYCLSGLQIKE